MPPQHKPKKKNSNKQKKQQKKKIKNNTHKSEPLSRVRSDVAIVLKNMYKQPADHRGLLVMIPSSIPLICNCATNLLLPNEKAKKELGKMSIPDTCQFNGWILVTTREHYKQWKEVRTASLETNHSYFNTAPFTILIYEQIGMLKALQDNNNNNRIENTWTRTDSTKLLLVFEHAEYLIDLIHKQPKLTKDIRFFNKTLYFSNNIEIGDFHTIFSLIHQEDTFPNNATDIREKHEKAITSVPRTLNKMILQPATRMMMQFVFVFCLVMNAKKIFCSKSEKTAKVHYNTHFYQYRRSHKHRRFLGTSRAKHTGRKHHRYAHDHPQHQRFSSKHTSNKYSERTSRSKKRSRRPRHGGLLMMLPPMLMSSTLITGLSGTFLFWLFSKNISVANTVANMLSFVFMLVPNIIKGIAIFTSKHSPIIEDACINAYWNLASVVDAVDNFIQSNATRTGFNHIWHGVETLVMGFSKTMLHLSEDDRNLIMAFFGLLCLVWLTSTLIRKFVYPQYEDSLVISNPNKENPLQKMIVVSCEKDFQHNNTTESQPFRKLRTRTVYYKTETVKKIIQQTLELHKLSSPYARQKALQDVVNADITDKYKSCDNRYHLRKANKRILVIVPNDYPNRDCTRWNRETSWVENECFVLLSVNDISSWRRKHIPELNAEATQIKYPAHEIHFISPPSNYERHIVVSVFAGTIKKADEDFIKGPFGFKVAREYNTKTTKLYEYIRPFHWFAWLATFVQPKDTDKSHQIKQPQVLNGARHALSPVHWLSTAISGIQSPEQMVSQRRKEISYDCEQMCRILCRHQRRRLGEPDIMTVFMEGNRIDEDIGFTKSTYITEYNKLKQNYNLVQDTFKEYFSEEIQLSADIIQSQQLKQLKDLKKKLGV